MGSSVPRFFNRTRQDLPLAAVHGADMNAQKEDQMASLDFSEGSELTTAQLHLGHRATWNYSNQYTMRLHSRITMPKSRT
jgi:hypothetical protein